jgi:hypothetical protein
MGIVLVLFFLTFKFVLIYYGYRDDYRRNPKEFWTTLASTPFLLAAFVLLNSFYVGWSILFFRVFEWLVN